MRALEAARLEVDRHNAANGGRGGIAAVARRIGMSRTALSLYLAGRYPAKSTTAIETRILRTLTGRLPCPAIGAEVTPDECADRRARPMPTSSPRALRQWHTCRTCSHNPERE
jgi:hypothetical protein